MEQPRPSPRDRWWFSPMLQVVAGAAVIGFQAGPVGRGTANWLNWLVAAAGLAVLLVGVRSWVRARPRRRTGPG
jgi:hypothetical protein